MEERGTCLTDKDGAFEVWVWNGVLHRDNGPASYNKDIGASSWYRNGRLHCTSGPALVDAGHPDRYFVDGIEYFNKLEWAVAVAAFKQEYPDEA